jgi:hypothetical protein
MVTDFCPKAALEHALTVAEPGATWHVQHSSKALDVLLVFRFDDRGASVGEPIPVRLYNEIEQDDVVVTALEIVNRGR